MKKPTKWKIFQDGDHLRDWASDLGPDGEMEPNGSKEHLMFYQDSYYLVYTDFTEEVVYRARKLSDREIVELALRWHDGDTPGKSDMQHRRSRA